MFWKMYSPFTTMPPNTREVAAQQAYFDELIVECCTRRLSGNGRGGIDSSPISRIVDQDTCAIRSARTHYLHNVRGRGDCSTSHNQHSRGEIGRVRRTKV